ncbi:hypothetical protein [Spirosoma utsteinense]|uniref:Uncharacterized protein n=1 Tax=Spirosoma utsteinense TaxID=2585773 RepID=A0ABR6W534_9BACT|nr:hypothetical protein [Spirosoma utsteinense]MBC3788049.1 hypothetical protein [Spirosoma utsteinense]MBC3791248.1 hypothetical protein [Spirosoma utsteinense]
MNTKQLLFAAGLVILASACQENDPVRPSYVVPATTTPTPLANEVDRDSAYTTKGKGDLDEVTPSAKTTRKDVMPIYVQGM